jgi:hypothetical protein
MATTLALDYSMLEHRHVLRLRVAACQETRRRRMSQLRRASVSSRSGVRCHVSFKLL